jgi:hypothetical protein
MRPYAWAEKGAPHGSGGGAGSKIIEQIGLQPE